MTSVSRLVLTRLKLLKGEWFLDSTVGTPWSTQILVEGGRLTADQAIKAVILGTQGVSGIASYSSSIAGRALSVQATINTIYGATTIAASL